MADYLSNAERYHFADFTRENYRRLLGIVKGRYRFRSYTDFDKEEQFVLWRHDVDYSMHAARKLARIEAEEGVRTTYFLHLHSEFYNLLEREITQCVRDIARLNHHVGLHFDTHYYETDNEIELEKMLSVEKRFLEDLLEIEINVFSFHNTTPFTMGCQKWQYAGMVNAYASYFQHEVSYCSDTNGYWRFQRLEDVLNDQTIERLQVLTHPEWWQDQVMSPRQRVQRCIDGRAQKVKDSYDALLKDNGRENVDWG